jgi:hypothetical protein
VYSMASVSASALETVMLKSLSRQIPRPSVSPTPPPVNQNSGLPAISPLAR